MASLNLTANGPKQPPARGPAFSRLPSRAPGKQPRRSLHIGPVSAGSSTVEKLPSPFVAAGTVKRDHCETVYDRDGNIVEVMCCDYGFRSGTGRLYQEGFGEIPKNIWQLGTENFNKELLALRLSVRNDDYNLISRKNPAQGPFGKLAYWIGSGVVRGLASFDKALEERELVEKIVQTEQPTDPDVDPDHDLDVACNEVLTKLGQLKLSNEAVWDRERAREKAGGGVESPWPIKIAYYVLCYGLDVIFNNRPVQRFWFLEVVARMPYFSYISMLHLYESLGWWRAGAELRKVHFAEEWNELHHLQIMETLGGDQLWVDRFVAQHAAVFYYWVLLLFYLVSPENAYNFSELIEAHAVDTYSEFIDANEEVLKALPPPVVACQYYLGTDIYMFDTFQTSKRASPRRPACSSLYDTFCNVRDDEGEHVKTMVACQDTSIAAELEDRRLGNGSEE